MPCYKNIAGKYQSNPEVEHWTAVKNTLKYLKRTKDMFLVYGGAKELVVNGYVDASFDTDPDDYKSQIGYVFILNGGAVVGAVLNKVSWRDLRVKRST